MVKKSKQTQTSQKIITKFTCLKYPKNVNKFRLFMPFKKNTRKYTNELLNILSPPYASSTWVV